MTNLFASPIPIQISLSLSLSSLYSKMCVSGYAKCYVFRYFPATKRSGLDTCCELHDLFKCSFFCSQCQTIFDWISVWGQFFGLFFDMDLEWTVQHDLFSTISYLEYGIFLKRRCWLLFSVDNGFKTVVSLVFKKK